MWANGTDVAKRKVATNETQTARKRRGVVREMKRFRRLPWEPQIEETSFSTRVTHALAHRLLDEEDNEIVDFFSGAGALNYGHNHPSIQEKVVDYLRRRGVTLGQDLSTRAMSEFLHRFHEVILRPRRLNYQMFFPGSGDRDSLAAAAAVARHRTGREEVLFATDSLEDLRDYLELQPRALDLPAAFIVRPLHFEGGLRARSTKWLRGLVNLARGAGILVIADETQGGCGRTGRFFSFEEAEVVPDLVCLSRSLNGFGLPLSALLMRDELGQFAPREGCPRGHSSALAFVAAREALKFWASPHLTEKVEVDGEWVRRRLREMFAKVPGVRGRAVGVGLLQALTFSDRTLARRIARAALEDGLLLGTAGAHREVLFLMPPLTIGRAGLDAGLDIFEGVLRRLSLPVVSSPLRRHHGLRPLDNPWVQASAQELRNSG